jgi:hypothetical protein
MHQNTRRIPISIAVPQSEELTATSMVEERVQGLLGLEDGEVVLQFQLTTTETRLDGLSVNVDSGDVEERRFPLADMASASSSGWWTRKIHLVANDMTLFEGIPGARGERLILKVARRNRALADDLVTALSFALSDLGHAHLDERIRRLESPADGALGPGEGEPGDQEGGGGEDGGWEDGAPGDDRG